MLVRVNYRSARSDILIDYPVNERPTRGGCGYRGAQTNLVMADTF